MNTSDVPESLNVRLELVDTKMAMDRLIRAIDLMRDDSGKPCGLFDSYGAEFYAHILINHIAALEARIKRLEAPVSDHEWYNAPGDGYADEVRRKFVAELIANRATGEPQQEEKGKSQ